MLLLGSTRRYIRCYYYTELVFSIERSFGSGDREASRDGGSSFNPVEPGLEARELVESFNAGELVTSDPITCP
jgi:hypothetical protein